MTRVEQRATLAPGTTAKRVTAAVAVAIVIFCLMLLAGCMARPAGPRPIVAGTPCAVCGMGIQDMRFACEREVSTAFRFYDAIECLLRDIAEPGNTWLADYDHATLHQADSLWVVQGRLPSPMGGGYAAFLDHEAAEEVAAATGGRVGRLVDFAGATPETSR